jgi:hypothetical protein
MSKSAYVLLEHTMTGLMENAKLVHINAQAAKLVAFNALFALQVDIIHPIVFVQFHFLIMDQIQPAHNVILFVYPVKPRVKIVSNALILCLNHLTVNAHHHNTLTHHHPNASFAHINVIPVKLHRVTVLGVEQIGILYHHATVTTIIMTFWAFVTNALLNAINAQ